MGGVCSRHVTPVKVQYVDIIQSGESSNSLLQVRTQDGRVHKVFSPTSEKVSISRLKPGQQVTVFATDDGAIDGVTASRTSTGRLQTGNLLCRSSTTVGRIQISCTLLSCIIPCVILLVTGNATGATLAFMMSTLSCVLMCFAGRSLEAWFAKYVYDEEAGGSEIVTSDPVFQ